MHLSEEDLILHYYREADADPRAETHLASCARCRSELDRLTEVLAMVEAEPIPHPPPGFERVVWARLQQQLPAPQVRGWRRYLQSAPRWAFAGAAAAIIVLAFLAGRFSQPASLVPTTGPTTAQRVETGEGVLLAAVDDHLDRSNMVLLELLNTGEREPADIEREQSRARDLVAANRLYRQTAVDAGEDAIGDVLDDLERVLQEIANAPSDVSTRELDALRAQIESRGLLFRVRVVQSEVRERERQVGSSSTTN
jgi:hypothetical protein